MRALGRYAARHHLALVALFVALGGTGYAVVERNSVTSKSIRTGAVRSAEVRDDALTGRDIREPTLDDVTAGRFALAGGAACDPPPAMLCAELELRLRRRGRVLAIADARSASAGQGSCRLLLDGALLGGDHVGLVANEVFSLSAVSGPVPAGPHAIALHCEQNVSNFSVEDARISAVALGRR